MKQDTIDLQSSFTRAVRSTACRALARHGSKISSIFYIAGNAVLIGKNGLQPGADALAGVLLTLSAGFIWFGAKTSAAFRGAGYCTVGGGLALIAASHGQPGFAAQVAGTLPLLVTGSLMVRASDAAKEGRIPRPDGFIRKYPVLAASMGQVLLRPFMFYSGYQRGDIGLMAGALCWGAGDLALGVSDPGVQEKLRAADKKSRLEL